MLPPEAIKEFKELYRKRYGVEISDEEAVLRANNLVNLYATLYGSDENETQAPGKIELN